MKRSIKLGHYEIRSLLGVGGKSNCFQDISQPLCNIADNLVIPCASPITQALWQFGHAVSQASRVTTKFQLFQYIP